MFQRLPAAQDLAAIKLNAKASARMSANAHGKPDSDAGSARGFPVLGIAKQFLPRCWSACDRSQMRVYLRGLGVLFMSCSKLRNDAALDRRRSRV